MTSRYRHRRTPNPGTAFPSPIEPGEIAVNTANRQIAVGDADSGTPGVPLTLIGVRVFDARASYAAGDFVVQGGALYRAKAAVNPGAFNAGSWDLLSTDVSIKAYADAGDAAVTTAFQAADAALTTSVNGKVAKAGDTMTGPLVLPVAAPTLDPQAANKKYVDDKIAAIPTPSSLTVADTPPVGVPDGALWWESDSGLLYVRYNDGNTIQWVIAAPQPDINAFALANTVVRYDTAQLLTAPQQQQARQNIYAAPFDAMAYSGIQINGGFSIDQEHAGASVAVPPSTTVYTVDGVKFQNDCTTAAFTCQQAASIFPGYNNELKLTVTTAQASLGASVAEFAIPIEGYRFQRAMWGTANAQPVTIGFWVKASLAGTYSVQTFNSPPAVGAGATITIASAGVAQFVTATFTAPPTSGTFLTTNGIGAILFIQVATSTSANLTATVGNTWEMTGLVVLPGNEAPSAARSPFVMRPFDQELPLCQRYFETSWNYGIAPGTPWPGGADQFNYAHPTANFEATIQCIRKRVVPTLTVYDSGGNPGKVSTYAAGWANGTVPIVGNVKDNMFVVQHTLASTNYTNFGFKLDARL